MVYCWMLHPTRIPTYYPMLRPLDDLLTYLKNRELMNSKHTHTHQVESKLIPRLQRTPVPIEHVTLPCCEHLTNYLHMHSFQAHRSPQYPSFNSVGYSNGVPMNGYILPGLADPSLVQAIVWQIDLYQTYQSTYLYMSMSHDY